MTVIFNKHGHQYFALQHELLWLPPQNREQVDLNSGKIISSQRFTGEDAPRIPRRPCRKKGRFVKARFYWAFLRSDSGEDASCVIRL